jgi:hypothetical protein
MRFTPNLILLVLAFAHSSTNAQIKLPRPLSGTYTVDPKGTGDRAFLDIESAVRYLSLVGVAGEFELRIAPGKYKGALTFFPVQGLKEDQKVVIRSTGQGKVILTSEGTIVLFQAGTKNIVLDGLTFGDSGNSPTIQSRGPCTDIEIRNCVFTGETGGNRVIEIQGKPASRRWNVHHNKFEMTGNTTYGIYTQATYQLRIHHNEFLCDSSREPISIWNANKSQSSVHDNVFLGSVRGCAMRLDVSGHDVDIVNNLFILELANNNESVIRSQGLRNGSHNRIRHNVFIIRGAGAAVRTRGPIGLDHNLYAMQEGGVGMTNNDVHESLKEWQAAIAEGFAVDEMADQNSGEAEPKFFDRYEQLMELFHEFDDETDSELDPDDPEAKAIAARKAREKLDANSEIQYLLKVLSETDPVAIRLAIKRLEIHGRNAIVAVPKLGKLCSHKHAAIRADAAESLGRIRIGAEIVIPELINMLDEKDERVLLAVVKTLGSFDHLAMKAAPRLKELEKHDLDTVKTAAEAARKAVLGEGTKK